MIGNDVKCARPAQSDVSAEAQYRGLLPLIGYLDRQQEIDTGHNSHGEDRGLAKQVRAYQADDPAGRANRLTHTANANSKRVLHPSPPVLLRSR